MADVSILGGDAVRGDADSLNAVAGFMRSVAQELHDVRTTLERHAFAEIWQGVAADAFRDLLRHTPDDLSRAQDSYDIASQAVGTYAGRLRDARSTAQALADRLAALEQQGAQLARSHQIVDQAVANARYAVSHTSDPAAHALAVRTLDDRLRSRAGLESQRNAVNSQIDAIRRQARANRGALDAAAQLAGDQLIKASHAGIRNSAKSWWDRHGDPLMRGAVAAVEAVTQTLIDAVKFIPDLLRYLSNPSWVKLSTLLGEMSAFLTVLGVIAFAVGVFVSGGALLVALPAVIMALKVSTALVDTTKLGVDGYRRKSGDTSVTDVDLAADAAAIGLDVIGIHGQAKVSGNWIGAIADSDSTAWKKWAAKCVIKGEGANLSWAELNAIKPIPLIVKDLSPDVAESVILDQAQDLGNKWLPGWGKPDAEMPSWMQTAVTRVKHTIVVPRLDPIVPLPMAAR